jgi:sporulation protein YlmC with PRC-barrel domain
MMANRTTNQPQDDTLAQSPDEVDSQAHVHVRMRVLGAHGKRIGVVDMLDRDTETGQLSALVVRHGILRNKRTSVPASRVKWVNSDSVILDLTPVAFNRLPRLATS